MVLAARVWRGRTASERAAAAMAAAATGASATSPAASRAASRAAAKRGRAKDRVPAIALNGAPVPVRDHGQPRSRTPRPVNGQVATQGSMTQGSMTQGSTMRPRVLALGPGGAGRPAPVLPAPARPAARPRPPVIPAVIEGVPVRARAGAPGAAPPEVSHDRPRQRAVSAEPSAAPVAARPVTTLPTGNVATTWPSPARPLRPVRTAPAPTEPPAVDVTPVEPASAQAAPVEAAPVEAAPVAVAPVDVAPVEAPPAEPAPVEEALVAAALVDVAPVEATPVDAVSAEPLPFEPLPFEPLPFEPVPTETAPTETAPTETAPTETAPVERAEADAVPVDQVPVDVAPVEAAPEQATSVEPEPEPEPEPVESEVVEPEPVAPPLVEFAAVEAAAALAPLAERAVVEPEPPAAPPLVIPPPAPPAPRDQARLEHSHEPAQAAPVAAVVETQNRAIPSVERALSGPAREQNPSWNGKVKIVTGAGASHGPGARDQEALDRNRARLEVPEPRRILVLGCTGGAGQTVTALMTGYMLASLREHPVAVVDLHDGTLARYRAPAAWLDEILAGRPPQQITSSRPDGLHPTPKPSPARLDVIASHQQPRDGDEIKLAVQLNRHYPLTVLDPGPSFLTRLLKVTDQLVVVVPANAEAAGALADTRDWLDNNGHAELAMQSVTVINGVSRRSLPDVEHAESIARGRSRAIVRIPWDDMLPVAAAGPSTLRPQTRVAYTALAGVLVAGLGAVPVRKKP